MNDAERDAWLREALRHAPDSDALPPSGVSEAILLKARAAARAAAPAGRRAASREPHANPLTAFWNWLARPPVAAGFASVMAATLVGLMWWDRPMDEGMPRPPAMANERAPAAPAPASAPEEISPATPAPAPAAAPLAPLTESTPATAPTPESRSMNAAGNAAARRWRRRAPSGQRPRAGGLSGCPARRARGRAGQAKRRPARQRGCAVGGEEERSAGAVSLGRDAARDVVAAQVARRRRGERCEEEGRRREPIASRRRSRARRRAARDETGRAGDRTCGRRLSAPPSPRRKRPLRADGPIRRKFSNARAPPPACARRKRRSRSAGAGAVPRRARTGRKRIPDAR